jgi:molecular chaperone GrpE
MDSRLVFDTSGGNDGHEQNQEEVQSMENTNPNHEADENGADVDSDIATLSDKLAEYENKLGEMRDVLLRERAEIENQRKRLQRDVEQARRFANERLLGDLLPVYDNLERGLMAEKADSAALREGMDLTLKALLKVGETNGLKQIDPLDQPFNPEVHQAMTMVESPGKEPNTVISVMQKGYVLNDRLLRPALVAISKAPGA